MIAGGAGRPDAGIEPATSEFGIPIEDRGLSLEVSEIRSQRSEVRDQRSEIRGQKKPWIALIEDQSFCFYLSSVLCYLSSGLSIRHMSSGLWGIDI